MTNTAATLMPNPLFVDFYELTMADVYLRNGLADKLATFSLYFRGYGRNRGYYLASGIDAAIDYLENLAFSDDDIYNISMQGVFRDDMFQCMSDLAFTGSVFAVREGEIVFGSEPVLEVTAPIIQAQIAETALLNIITTATLFATKASRIVQAAQGRPVIDMGARRTHGPAAALVAARSAFAAGFRASSLSEAPEIGVPVNGTMAHSFIQAMPDELTAFRRYAERFPDGTTLLVDTYDTVQGVRNAITVAHELAATGGRLRAVRLDSGDLGALANTARKMLDDADLPDVRIIASGGLDEYAIDALVSQSAPIDAFGVGTKFGTSADSPYIESVYKLVEFDGRPVSKQSEGKRTLPYPKQVYRTFDAGGVMQHDTVTRRDEPPVNPHAAIPLLQKVMHDGRRLIQPEPLDEFHDSLDETRARIAASANSLPDQYRKLRDPDSYPVHFSDNLTTQ